MNHPANHWVEAARQGDPAAARRLVDDFHPRIYAFLRRLSGSESEAVELTQQTFCRAWAALAGFAGRSSVSSWLHGIAYRTYVDWLRAERRSDHPSDEWWLTLADPAQGPDRLVADADSAAHTFAAVDRLEPGLRQTVHLHYYQGLTLDETAEVLGTATSTVKYRLRQALGELRRVLVDRPAGIASTRPLSPPLPTSTPTPPHP
jgi:RNA polymerase sigma-70 factor (ECF subfamily)